MTLAARMMVGVMGLIASDAALAHAGAHPGGGWAAGFVHPFAGLDHVLAMAAVGAWAAQAGGRCLVLIPATFVAAMAAGAAAAHGVALPQIESMLALSVLALGLLVALAVKAQSHWPVTLIALFAMFHGHAHGAEMPQFSSPTLYFAGFLAATSVLHALGVAAGVALKAHPGIQRAGGLAIGLAGSWLLFTAVA